MNKLLTPLFLFLLFSCFSALNAQEFEQDSIVLFPVKIQPEAKYTERLAAIYSARIQQGLQQQFKDVYAGDKVEKQLELEYSKESCTVEECIQNIAVNFSTTLIVEPTIYLEDGASTIILKFINIEDTTKSLIKTKDCPLCSNTDFSNIIENLAANKQIIATPAINTAIDTADTTSGAATPIKPKQPVGQLRLSNIKADERVIVYKTTGEKVHNVAGAVTTRTFELDVGYYTADIFKIDHQKETVKVTIKKLERENIDIADISFKSNTCNVKVFNQQRFEKSKISIKGTTAGGVIIDNPDAGFAPANLNLIAGTYRIKTKYKDKYGSKNISCITDENQDITINISDRTNKSGFKLSLGQLTGNESYTAQRVGVSFMIFSSQNLGAELKVFSETASNANISSTAVGYGGGLVLFKYLIVGSNVVNYNEFKIGNATLNYSGYSETYVGVRIPIKGLNIELKTHSVDSSFDSLNQLFSSGFTSLGLGYKF